jgi:plasmid replication initiation protein
LYKDRFNLYKYKIMKANGVETLKSKTPKVYKDKKLNNANFGDFTHTDYKVYSHLISKIGGVDEYGKYLQPEKLQRKHILTAQEFNKMFNTDLHNSYGFLKQSVDKLMKTNIRVERPGEEGYWRINVCSAAEYNEKEGHIIIEFTDRIMPYLAQEVKQKFVLYNLKEVSGFHSLYTTRLYELIQEFKETGWIRKSLEQLREIFAVGNRLALYADFKKKTFEHACKEINKIYDMGLSFKELKEGRKIVAIEFSFKKTIVQRVINPKTGVSSNIYTKPKRHTTQELPAPSGFKSITDAISGLGLLNNG